VAEPTPAVMLASVADVVAALRVELPAIVRAAVRAEMQRAELPPDVSPRRYAELSGLSPATVRRRIADGTIAAKKIGARVLVSTASLSAIDEVAIARSAMKAVAG
jgi:hypothetical protein